MENFKVQLAFILLANIANSIVLNQLYPYVALLVEHFGMAERSTTGYYAGYLTCAIMVGRMLGSGPWGWSTDRWGRKPSLVVSLLMVGAACIGLGCSRSLLSALLFRFLTGFLNSVLVVTKTLVSEICPEHYHAQGMSWLSLTRHIGLVIGTLAGTLVDPVYAQYFEGTILDSFPFFLPNALAGLACFVSAIGIQLYVRETLDTEKPTLQQPLLPQPADTLPNTYWTLLQDYTVMLTILLYSLSCSVNSAVVDLIPVWSWAQTSHGGLELSIQAIGYLTITANIVMALLQQILFARLVEAKGYVWVRLCGCLCIVPATLLIPFAHDFLSTPLLFWPYLITSVCLWYLFMYQIFTVEFILINNAVVKKQRGKANGLALGLSSLARAAASPACTVLFAATATGGLGFPLDYTCAFTVNAGICMVTYFMTAALPVTIERPKDAYIESK